MIDSGQSATPCPASAAARNRLKSSKTGPEGAASAGASPASQAAQPAPSVSCSTPAVTIPAAVSRLRPAAKAGLATGALSPGKNGSATMPGTCGGSR